MIDFKEFLKETGDQTYPFTRKDHTNNVESYYEFKTENNRKGYVYIRAMDYEEYDDESVPILWDVTFAVNGNLSTTGGGDAFKIFSTVIKAMEDWYKIERPVGSINFSAARESDGKESRIKLYRTILRKFAKQYRYTVFENDTGGGVNFFLE